MNITQPLHNMISNSFSLTNIIRSGESSCEPAKESETKLNFQEVMEKTKDNQLANTFSASSTIDYPLESYALPSWFGSYLPWESALSSELNYDFWEFAGKVSEDNVVTDEERNQLQNYLSNDPFHKAELEKRAFKADFESEIGEYFNFLFSSFKDILKENDIDSREDYYQKIILDKDNSERLHMEMNTRLNSNSRVLELMDMLLS